MIRNLLATILFVVISQLSFAQDLTLEQTLDYLKQKIDKFGHFDAIKAGWHTETKLGFQVSESDQCQIKIIETQNVSDAGNREKIKESNSTNYTFELKHLLCKTPFNWIIPNKKVHILLA